MSQQISPKDTPTPYSLLYDLYMAGWWADEDSPHPELIINRTIEQLKKMWGVEPYIEKSKSSGDDPHD